MLNEGISIATRVAIVDNTKLTIQVGGHTPQVVLLDTSAQPVILGIQFVKKMASNYGNLLQLHFRASVRMKLTFPKVRTWSPPGLPKTQSSIAWVKTPCIEVFFISLKRS